MGIIRFAAVSIVGAAIAIAAPVAASATPGSPSKPHPTTTTTTPASKNAQAFAKLVIKPSSIGHVNVKTAKGSTFKPAKDGQSLHVGDTVQTDATGQAEIDYADTAYTRLDVNTTFTIKKLTDSQGNRQVEGSLDVGRTYNRTAALTQSQTFQQDGGGATAAVAGTAFVVTCTSATTCTFTAVIDNINLTGAGGQTKTLNPLDECVDTNGALCGTTTRLTPDELALLQWIQTNVYLDLAEHGIGTGVFQPFAGTVVVNGATVQSFTPSTPNQGFTPQPSNSPPSSPAQALAIDSTNPIILDPSTSPTPANNITIEDDGEVNSGDQHFKVNASDPNTTPQDFSVQFIGPAPTKGTLCAPNSSTVSPCPTGYAPVVLNQSYPKNTDFVYHTTQTNETVGTPVTDSFTTQAVSNGHGQPPSAPTQVPVNIVETTSAG
jgi:hypothetical protein